MISNRKRFRFEGAAKPIKSPAWWPMRGPACELIIRSIRDGIGEPEFETDGEIYWCKGYAKSAIDDEPCETCKRCKYCALND